MTPAEAVWEKLGFCDCGNPEDVLGLFQLAIRAMVDRGAAETHGNSYWTQQNEMAQRIETRVLPLDDPNALLLRYVLDAAGLTWHGGSVFGSRPSEEGLALLKFLDETPKDDWTDDE